MKIYTIKYLFTSCFLLIASFAFTQATTVLVESVGGTTAYSDLQTALSAAQNGDKIYLSGGIHNPDGDNVIVNKQLEIVGAGFDLDTLVATNASIIRGNLTLVNGASNCILRGFKVEDGKLDIGSGLSSTDDVTNIFAELCWFEEGIDFSDSGNAQAPPSVFLIRHCAFGDVAVFYALDVTIQNCLVFGNLTTAYNGVVVDHCLFENGSSVTLEANNGMITNCIFLGSSFFSSGESNIFANNVFTDLTPGFDVEDQVENAFLSNEAAIFGELLDLNFNPDVDYSTLPGSIVAGNATDGSTIGHEGGTTPWPSNYLPNTPYIWNESTIATQTNSNGDLPVSIKVSAQ